MMTIETLTALAALLLPMLWTPGPNNAMLASSGATFGFRPTLPHLFGVAFGFALMLFAVALGLGTAFQRFPQIAEILRYVGAAVLLWLAWRIATSTSASKGSTSRKPFTFTQAAAFQWVNPKAWVMCIALVSQFTRPGHALGDSLALGIVAAIFGLGSAAGWTGFGASLQRLLARPSALGAFNALMALLIVLSVVMLLME